MYNVGLAKVLALEDDGRGGPLRHGQRGEALRPAGLVLGELEQLTLVEVQLARLNGKLHVEQSCVLEVCGLERKCVANGQYLVPEGEPLVQVAESEHRVLIELLHRPEFGVNPVAQIDLQSVHLLRLS